MIFQVSNEKVHICCKNSTSTTIVMKPVYISRKQWRLCHYTTLFKFEVLTGVAQPGLLVMKNTVGVSF